MSDGRSELVIVCGRSDEDWDLLADAGLAFLVERARLAKLTSYTELNATLERRTGLTSFDFSRADERAATGHLLYLIVEQNRPSTGLMISALVTYLDANDAGTGFYAFAQELSLLPSRASAQEKLDFWVGQVSALHQHYSRRSGPIQPTRVQLAQSEDRRYELRSARAPHGRILMHVFPRCRRYF